MPQSHTHQDPEQLARPTAAGGITRNVHGQSLDNAREAFRAEWQAKVERKRQQAEHARTKVQHFKRLLEKLMIWCQNYGGESTTFGHLIGLCVMVPLGLLAIGCAAVYRKRAERLDQEVRAMGYRKDPLHGRRRRKRNSR